jgi:hypothetical protein
VTDAIGAWHDHLATGTLGAESAAWLDARQRERGLAFGDRPLCTVLRPRFLTPMQHRDLATACRDILGALHVAGEAALADGAFRATFRLGDWEEALLGRLPRHASVAPLIRLDAFLDPSDGTPRLTEVNGETPAGSAYGDALTELFLGLPVMRAFARDWSVRPLPTVPSLLATLLACWHDAGRSGTPRVAIVDWADLPTASEFRLVRDYLGRMGVPCVIATPESLSFEGGVLRDGDGARIDLVYKRVLLHELVAEHGVDHPLLAATAAGAAVLVNSIHGKPLHKKASLAVLTDERHAHRFTAAQQAAIARHVPWTRVIEPRRTVVDGREVDLLEWIAAHRDECVLKPNDDYGGAGIVLGWEVGAAEWDAAIATALAAPYVVQRRVSLPSEPFAAWHDGALVLDERIVDTAPYCWQGAWMEGCLTRISTSTLVNVTAGGGSTIPTFVVEPR